MNAVKPRVVASELREAVASVRPHMVRAMWFSVFTSLLVLTPSWYMLQVYDRVVNSRSLMTLAMLTVVALAAFWVMELVEWSRAQVMHQAALKLDAALSSRVFRAVFDANLHRHPAGNVQPLQDLRTVTGFLHSPAFMALMEAPLTPIFLLLLFAISPWVGVAAILGALVQVLITWLNERATRGPLTQANQTAVRAQQYADGTLRNAQVIEAMGMIQAVHSSWIAQQYKMLLLQAKASEKAGMYSATSRCFQQFLSSLLLGLSAWLLLHDQLNGGGSMLIVSSILGGRMLAPLVQVVAQWAGVVAARNAWKRLEGLLTDIPAPEAAMALPAPHGAVVVEGVVAAAPGTQSQILRGVSFSLEPGQVLAVVGPSACGKTSLARLLVGVWPSLAGKVRLDGVDVFSWNKTELGPHIGYLPQGVELFEGTLAENIARFGEVNMAQVHAAAQLVGMHEAILALPDGYETQIGRYGSMLSGGQRQRVALARALYGSPAFVVLDEPNSNLDEEGEAALARAVVQMKQRGTTLVVITHRTSILSVVDKMLVMRDGTTQAYGPRNEVLAALRKSAQAAQQAAAVA